jgi:surface polysaccharide O-acyltransferase-like enzyme
MERFRLHKVFYIALPLLLLLRASMETYTNSFSHFDWFDWHFSGNFLVGALPVMVLGNYICSREEKLLKHGARVFLPAAVGMMALVFFTVNVRILGMDLSQPFKIAAATMFFLLCLAVPLKKPVAVLDAIGRRLALHIYIWHLLVGELLRDLMGYMGAEPWIYDWCLPIAATAVTLLLSALLTGLTAQKKTARAQ